MPQTKAVAAAPGYTQTNPDLTAGEQAAHDARAAAYDADDALAEQERAWRDAELVSTDHYGLSDLTMSTEMTTYRQELRDMPDLAGFPNTHTRPTRPAGE